MNKTLYRILWIICILLIVAIMFSSAVMFANGGGVLEGVFDFEDDREEETKRKPSSTTKNPTVTYVPITPEVTTRPNTGVAENTTVPDVLVGTVAPDIPDYPYTDGLEFKLNPDGASYCVSDGSDCTDKKIIIPLYYKGLPVTKIAQYAFYMHDLTDIEIPETVQVIGESAFRGCENLTYIDLPKELITIEKAAFADCISLKTVVIYAELKTIGIAAFQNCHSLKFINYWGSNWKDIEKGTNWDAGCSNYDIAKG